MLYINNDGNYNSFELPENSWYLPSLSYTSVLVPYIEFAVYEAGVIFIEYDTLYYNPLLYLATPIYPNVPFKITSSSAGFVGGIQVPNPCVALNLTIRFVPGAITTTSSTTTTLYPIPENPEIFLHVGNINVSGESCGNYKYTLEGADSNYFSLYGQRIYLTKYPHTAKTYNINICAKDLANRFTPVCDTFSLTVNQCEFTTEPPTTTAAPNFGFVQQENNVTPVNQYTYNKIYSVRKYK